MQCSEVIALLERIVPNSLWIGLIASLLAFLYYLFFYFVKKPPQGQPRPAAIFITAWGKRVNTVQPLKDNQQLPLALEADDQFGNPTQAGFDSPPAWSLDDPSFGSLSVADDGLSASLASSGKLGDLNVSVVGVVAGQSFTGSLGVTVIPGDAASIKIIPGTPVNNPVPAAAKKK